MPIASLNLVLDGTIEASGPDFDVKDMIHLSQVTLIGMPHGTKAGRATVMMRFVLPDGQTVFAETTLRLLAAAVKTFASRYPDEVPSSEVPM